MLIVDLNNFASFPTLAIGLLVAALRMRGDEVRLISPLANDVPATLRERPETWFHDVKRRMHLSTRPVFTMPRNALRAAHAWINERPHPIVLREFARALKDGPDVVLISAYLQHFRTVREIGKLALEQGTPLLLGGPMFNIAETADSWRGLPGVTAIVGAEADRSIGTLVDMVAEGHDVAPLAGIILPDGRRGPPAPPLRELDEVPVPDFTDFPWDRYPVKVVPIMTGRGCQWDKCTFCSDVISVSGRTFRTRSVESVLLEMEEQAQRHETTNFLFLDLKLNSWPDMMRGIAAQVQSLIQGAEWIGSVHVDQRRDNGLSRADLEHAVRGGMRRVSFGLESGSQRLLDLMRKGCSVDRNSQFIRDAHAAGLSIRCTMFKGFPGETAEDMEQTADFLESHASFLDRVQFNEFSLLQDTPIHKSLLQKKADADGFEVAAPVARRARVAYRNRQGQSAAYRRAKARALSIVHAINREPVRAGARQFDGMM